MNDNCKRLAAAATVAVLMFGVTSCASERDTTVKEDAKDVGRAVGSAVREVGQGAKEVGKAIGHATVEGVEAAKEGGRELKKAVKGE